MVLDRENPGNKTARSTYLFDIILSDGTKSNRKSSSHAVEEESAMKRSAGAVFKTVFEKTCKRVVWSVATF